MSRLSPHFTIAEFVKSQTAERKGIENTPGDKHVVAMMALCENVLEPIRNHFDKPVVVNSGYRSAALCRAIGSKTTSQHCKGQAADIEIPGIANAELAQYIANELDFDQLILECYERAKGPSSGWVHVSYNAENNRHEYKEAYKNDEGKTRYRLR